MYWFKNRVQHCALTPKWAQHFQRKAALAFFATLLPVFIQGCSSWIATQSTECMKLGSNEWLYVGVGWRKENSPLFTVDPQTNEAPRIMWTGVPHLNSLALSRNGRLYSIGGKDDDLLVVLDPSNGEVKSKKKLSLGAPRLAHGSQLSVRALALNQGDELFAVTTDGYSDAQSFLYKINPATGATFLVGTLNTAGVQGLDFGPDGALYGWAVGGRSERGTGLVRIDPRAAQVKDMNFWKGGGPEIQSLVFTPNCELLGGGDHIVRIGRDHHQTVIVHGFRLSSLYTGRGDGGTIIRGLGGC